MLCVWIFGGLLQVNWPTIAYLHARSPLTNRHGRQNGEPRDANDATCRLCCKHVMMIMMSIAKFGWDNFII